MNYLIEMKKFLIKKQIMSGRKAMLVAYLATKRQFRATGCLLGKLIWIKCMIVPGHILDFFFYHVNSSLPLPPTSQTHSRVITAESSPLHIGSSWTRTRNLWFLSNCKSLTSKLCAQNLSILIIMVVFCKQFPLC